MKYDSLDTNASYSIRIAYTGRFRSSDKLIADGKLIHPYLKMGNKPIVEVDLPKEITTDGTIRLTFSCAQEVDGEAERGTQVAEIWLIKKRE